MKFVKYINLVNMTYALSVFNTGQITIPKAIRERKFRNAKNLIAEETEDGLLIKPLDIKTAKPEIVIMPYKKETEKGLLFPRGIEVNELIRLLEDSDE